MASQSLKDKTVKGVFWSAIDTIASQGVTFMVGIVLARLLSPDEYGLIGIITIFISIFNVFINSGFNAALIRKQNTTEADYNTVFYYNLITSILLFICFWMGAPYIANFFKRDELLSLCRVMGCILIINAFSIIQATILTKKIDFKKQTKVSMISSISSGIIGIGMAIEGFGVWSIVGQQISRQGLYSLFLWIYSDWRPKLIFSKNSFYELWNFGSKLLCSSLINALWNEVYQIVIGKYYTPAALGQYTRASQFGGIFSVNLTNVVQRVSYPVLSNLQGDVDRMKDAYRRIIKQTMFVSFFCMFQLAAFSKTLIIILIGDSWTDCIYYLQIISFTLMFHPLHALNLNMLQVQGRSDLFLKIEIYKKMVGVIPICMGIFINIYAMLIGSVFAGLFALYLNAYYSGPLLNYSLAKQLKDIIPSFSLSLILAVPIYFLSFLNINCIYVFILQIFITLILGYSVMETIKFPEYLEIKQTILKRFTIC